MPQDQRDPPLRPPPESPVSTKLIYVQYSRPSTPKAFLSPIPYSSFVSKKENFWIIQNIGFLALLCP